MLAAHLWDHAKTAWMIAALRNFHISGMRRRKSETRCVVIGNVRGPRRNKAVAGIDDAGRIDVALGVTGVTDRGYNFLYDRSKLRDLIEPNKCVYLRQFVMQFS